MFNLKICKHLRKKGKEYKADLERPQVGEIILDLGQDSSIFAEYSRDKYACEVYDQFVNQEGPMIIDDFIGNYMFLSDPYLYDLNPILLSSCNHYAEEKFEIFDDHKLILREQEGHQFSNRGTATDV